MRARQAFVLIAAFLFLLPSAKAQPPCWVQCPEKHVTTIEITFDPPEDLSGWPIQLGVAIGSDDGAFSPPNALTVAANYQLPFGSYNGLTTKIQDGFLPHHRFAFDAKVRADLTFENFPALVRVYDWNEGVGQGAELGSFFLYKSQLGAWWQPWSPGSITPSGTSVLIEIQVLGPDPIPPHPLLLGKWLFDNLKFTELPEGFEMSKAREIREKMVERIGEVLESNGFPVSIGETRLGPFRVPDSVSAWPHVQVIRGGIQRQVNTFTEQLAVGLFRVGVFCRRTDTVNPDDQCDDALAAIHKSISKPPNAPGANAMWLGLNYVESVRATDTEPPEKLPDEISRDIKLLVQDFEVTYHETWEGD
jgi:hypothetical protein